MHNKDQPSNIACPKLKKYGVYLKMPVYGYAIQNPC